MRTSSITVAVTEITHPRHCWRRGGILLLLVVGMLTFPEHSAGSDPDLASLRMQAHFHVALVRTLQFSYRYESDIGTTGNAEFVVSGDQFRLDRVDVTGSQIHGEKGEPISLSTAYNGQRQQRLDVDHSAIRLKDGSEGATYAFATPQTLAYGWLRMPTAPPLRWDLIVSSAVWEERFADATYVGTVNEDGRVLEVVEFPQRKGVRTPCIFKVFLDPDLGYLPVKYVRRVEKTGEFSSTMEVTRFKVFDIDGQRIAIPTEVTHRETGADGVSLRMNRKVTVDESK